MWRGFQGNCPKWNRGGNKLGLIAVKPCRARVMGGVVGVNPPVTIRENRVRDRYPNPNPIFYICLGHVSPPLWGVIFRRTLYRALVAGRFPANYYPPYLPCF